ncbi:MAG: OmpA family protein, partial [Magnetococcales bacterium]|nr:OmpA family protein [Magnetococcales bacterium]
CYFCKLDAADGDDDKDGVPNSRDKCPGTPKGAQVDANGCSDLDQDGVIDPNDKCPDTPKGATVNSQGCWVLKNLNFKTNSAVIESKDEGTLHDTASVLKNNPTMKVEIQGHTDNVGKGPYNKKLSQARANEVMMQLIARGIAKSRLSAHGYGMEKPVTTNATEAGRAENRRVELRVLK